MGLHLHPGRTWRSSFVTIFLAGVSFRVGAMMPATPGEIAVRPSERMLIAALEEIDESAARRVLCTSLGRGQLATAAALRFPQARVVCHFLDVDLAAQARACQSPGPENLSR